LIFLEKDFCVAKRFIPASYAEEAEGVGAAGSFFFLGFLGGGFITPDVSDAFLVRSQSLFSASQNRFLIEISTAESLQKGKKASF
jgi:hypothetical protein